MRAVGRARLLKTDISSMIRNHLARLLSICYNPFVPGAPHGAANSPGSGRRMYYQYIATFNQILILIMEIIILWLTVINGALLLIDRLLSLIQRLRKR